MTNKKDRKRSKEEILKDLKRKTTSIKVNPTLWEEVKIHCIRNKIDISDFLERIIESALKTNDLEEVAIDLSSATPEELEKIKKQAKKLGLGLGGYMRLMILQIIDSEFQESMKSELKGGNKK